MTSNLILIVVGALLALLAAYFIWRFVVPYYKVRSQLDHAIGVMTTRFELAQAAGGHVTDLEGIGKDLEHDARLFHLWEEFADTLHAEHSDVQVDLSGQSLAVRYRQTMPAELYFSTRTLVDVPLRTDFFRNLPGILTGLGIIGTFGGLIVGLTSFSVSGQPDQVNNSVGELVSAVRHAFWASFAAISLAIIVTGVERIAFARLQGQVQHLQQVVDRMFDTGASEEYLASIAQGSEQSATHLAHLKEGLVNDLKHLLDDFANRQTTAMNEAAAAVSAGVADTFQAPLASLTSAMERSLEDQQSVVHKLLDESLDAFAGRLEEMVGAKLTGAAEHVEAAAGSMREALTDAPLRIEQAADRVRVVLDEIAASAAPFAEHAERVSAAADKLATTVEQSAETLDYAIGRFRSLGEEIGASVDAASQISAALGQGAAQAQNAAAALGEASTQLNEAQSQLSSVAESLADVAAQTEGDREVQRQLAESVERAAAQLSAAQASVNQFLQDVDDELTQTHETFAREINSTLNRTHETFHHSLATATELLAGTVKEFGDFLEGDFRESVDHLQREMARLSVDGNSDAAR